uniref:Orf2 protein n=1 Tax=Neisseria gonorrhoeae TaxID=485 RepID=Q53478_NEIGO|nr:orf2 gene product [Neisseria gonorrhoeae]
MPQHQHLAVQVASILADQAFLALRIQISRYQQCRTARHNTQNTTFPIIIDIFAFRRPQKLEIHAVPLPTLFRTMPRPLIKFRLSGINPAVRYLADCLKAAVVVAVVMRQNQLVQTADTRRIQTRHDTRLCRRYRSRIEKQMAVCRPHKHRQALPRIPNRNRSFVFRYCFRTVGYKPCQQQHRPRTQTQAARQQQQQSGTHRQHQQRQRCGGNGKLRRHIGKPHQKPQSVFRQKCPRLLKRRKRHDRTQQRQRGQHPRKPRYRHRIDQRADQRQRGKQITEQNQRQHRSRPLPAHGGLPFPLVQTPCTRPYQGRHQTERQPSTDTQNRQRVEQQHRRQRLPPRRPRRQSSPAPRPRERRQHQNTALRRHGKTGKQRVKQRARTPRRQNPRARPGGKARGTGKQPLRQPRKQHRHHRNVQTRNTDQMRQPQRPERLPQSGAQCRLFAHAQRAHQPDAV